MNLHGIEHLTSHLILKFESLPPSRCHTMHSHDLGQSYRRNRLKIAFGTYPLHWLEDVRPPKAALMTLTVRTCHFCPVFVTFH